MSMFKSWFASRGWIAALGLLCLAVLIWLGGPYLGFGDAHPLAGAGARGAAILLLVLIWVLGMQWRQWQQRRRAEQMSAALVGQEAQMPVRQRERDEHSRLQQRFQTALATLRRRGGRHLHSLPWYAVIGPPGAGKSTLLQQSGLAFALPAEAGTHAVGGIGGTRDCDWWFTDEAIFLDTAGRYVTQDSEAAVDASAWRHFLALLRRYRRRQPLHGVIVAISVTDLLAMDEDKRQQHVRIVRRRLQELTESLKLRLPVYLLLTKSDLVAGFSEFFDDLSAEQRAQVWGMTFAVEASVQGQAAACFDREFEGLLQRLGTRLAMRLHDERDPVRRASILAFPQQLNALRQVAGAFVEGVFGSAGSLRPALLRGVYMTSGTQQGTPIDRMLQAVAQTFDIETARVSGPMRQPRTFFVQRLLKDVVFRESAFSSSDPLRARRRRRVHAAAALGIVALTLLLVAGFATSYAGNRRYLQQLQVALQPYARTQDLAGSASLKVYLARALQRLDVLAHVQAKAGRYASHVPLSMRLGLYQGRAMTAQVHQAYLRELNDTLLPAAGLSFRQGLAEQADDPEALYAYLKGYLMLGQPRHRDAAELATLGQLGWRQVFPDDAAARKALDGHFRALLDDPDQPRALPLDDGLLQRARATLRTADLATLIYGKLKLDVARSGAPPVRLDQTLGLLGQMFVRKSGQPLSRPLPALYTRALFAAVAGKGIDRAIDGFVKDDWVFGPATIDPLARSRYRQRVLELYQQDYIRAWDGLLADLQLKPAGSLQAVSSQAARLSAPSSPLKALLLLLADNTHDLLRAHGGAPAGRRALKAGGALAARQVLNRSQAARDIEHSGVLPGEQGDTAEVPAGRVIEQHFAALDRLVQGPAGSTPLDHTLTVIGQLGQALLVPTDASAASAQTLPAMVSARQAVTQLPAPLPAMLSPLTEQSQKLVADDASRTLQQGFRQAAGSDCRRLTQGRYPFSAAGHSDIPLQNFAELFGNGGRFDTFFRQTLAPLVDTSGRRWRWRTPAHTGSAAVLAEAQLADQIRQRYFRQGLQPDVDFRVSLVQVDPGIAHVSLDLGGQRHDFQAGDRTAVAMHWPGPAPGLVTLGAKDRGGQPVGAPLRIQGDWAWFHALDAAHLKRLDELHFQARFDVGGHQVTLQIQPASLIHPFLFQGVHAFRCAG